MKILFLFKIISNRKFEEFGLEQFKRGFRRGARVTVQNAINAVDRVHAETHGDTMSACKLCESCSQMVKKIEALDPGWWKGDEE